MSKRNLPPRKKNSSSTSSSKKSKSVSIQSEPELGYVSENSDTELTSRPSTARALRNIEDMQKKLLNVVEKKSDKHRSAGAPHKKTTKLGKKAKGALKPSPVVDAVDPNAANAERYKFEYLKTPLKPASDKKEYRVIKLRNGLRAILISDVPNLQEVTQCLDESTDESEDDSEAESDSDAGTGSDSEMGSDSETGSDTAKKGQTKADDSQECDSRKKAPPGEEKMAAVGLTIGVGSFSDPDSVPGLAHFLEHMVFMGSAKFPRENHFDSFVKRQGGSDNAHTDCETTTFYFECQERNLSRGMDKFVQFFTCPLMKREAMKRERQAVESEFQESMSSDYDRGVQLLAGLAKPGHPAGKFTWGNEETLRAGITDAKIHKALHAFRKRHYSGHRMTLAVQARLPMSDLESLVARHFSDVPSNNQPPDDFTTFKESFATPEFNRLYRVSSIKNRLSLDLTWMLPPCLHLYRSKPYEYVEGVLDHEGEGTLLAHLRDKLWALSLQAVHGLSGFENNSMYFLFTVNVTLTEEGYKHLDQVVWCVFSYLRMLRAEGPCERLFNEIRTMSEANFHYSDECQASDYVEELSEGLQYYEAGDVIAAPHLLVEYKPELIVEFQDALTVEGVNVMVSSLDSTIDYDQQEKWFKTKYKVTDLDPSWVTSWRQAAPLPSFHLPHRNRFLPTDFSLLTPPADEADDPLPIAVDATPLCEVWYKRDAKFRLPIAYLYFYLVSPELCTDPLNAVLLDIYADMLEHELATELYAAKAAAISYSLLPCNNGISIRVGGFNQHLLVVVETIFRAMAGFKQLFKQQLFDAIKQNRVKAYYNSFIKPGKLNSDLRLKLLVNHHWTSVEKHSATANATAESLVAFVERYNGTLYVQSLAQGNLSRHQALKACHLAQQYLNYAAIPEDKYPQYRVGRVDLGERVLRVKSCNAGDANSVITNYYQSGPGTLKSSCLVELALSLVEEPLFDRLRTKEQLGYDVGCEMRDTHGILGYTVTVNYQEDKRSVESVASRIDSFLKSFHKTNLKLTDKIFEEARSALIKLKQCADVHLKEEVARNWSEVLSNEYVFDRHLKEVALLATVTRQEVQEWFDQHFQAGNASNFRKLSIQVVAAVKGTVASPRRASSPLEILKGGESFVDDIDVYRKSLYSHPLHRILN